MKQVDIIGNKDVENNKKYENKEIYNPFTSEELEKIRREEQAKENEQSYKYIPTDEISL